MTLDAPPPCRLGRRAALAVGGGALAAPCVARAQAARRRFVDDAGRAVDLPAGPARRVFSAGPPATVAIVALAPDTLAGWTRALSPAEAAYLPERLAALPVTGRLTGRGGDANLEAVLRAQPDLVLDLGTVNATYASLADRVQAQTGVPTSLIGGRLTGTPTTLRRAGEAMGVPPERVEALAGHAARLLDTVRERVSALPAGERARVYLARGPRGLQTAVPGSINAEVLEVAGGANVAAGIGGGTGNLADASMERVLGWDPDAVLTFDRGFFGRVRSDPLWSGLRAVREGRVFLSPDPPFTWVDSPPGLNRVIGARWLAGALYPRLFPEDTREETRAFYAAFYHRTPTEAQLDDLLGPVGSGGATPAEPAPRAG